MPTPKKSPAGTEDAPASSNGTGGKDTTAPTIQTVQRAAIVLGSFSVTKPHLSLNELTASLGTSKATAHRYTKALRAAHLLRYDERTALYSLGPQVLTLAASARAGLPIVATAEPFLEQLLQEVDETVVLSVWDGETATVVRSVDNTDHIVQIGIRPGSRLNLTDSAQGRVFCSFLPPEQVPNLKGILRRQPELAAEFDVIRAQGLSLNSPHINGVRTIAAPIFEGGTIIASMAIIGTAVSVSDDVNSDMAKALSATTQRVSEALGATGF